MRVAGVLRRKMRNFLRLGGLFTAISTLAATALAGDYTLRLSYYHQIHLMGVPAKQEGEWLVRLHPPNGVRLDMKGSNYPVIYRYSETGLTRYEMDVSARTYTKQNVAESRERLKETYRESGLQHDMDGPAYLMAGMGTATGWQEVFREGTRLFLHYLVDGRIVAAAAVETGTPAPPETMIFAFLQELPIARHYWVGDAFSDLLKYGMTSYFEYAPPGPEYYQLRVLEMRTEPLMFSEELFYPPKDYKEVKGETPTAETDKGAGDSPKENLNGKSEESGRARTSGKQGSDRGTAGADADAVVPGDEHSGNDKQKDGERKPAGVPGEAGIP
jgi:hypothetical protein